MTRRLRRFRRVVRFVRYRRFTRHGRHRTDAVFGNGVDQMLSLVLALLVQMRRKLHGQRFAIPLALVASKLGVSTSHLERDLSLRRCGKGAFAQL